MCPTTNYDRVRNTQELEAHVKELASSGRRLFAKHRLHQSRLFFSLCIAYQKRLLRGQPDDAMRRAELIGYMSRSARIAAMQNDFAESDQMIRQVFVLIVALDADGAMETRPVALKLIMAQALVDIGWALMHVGDSPIANMLAIGAFGTLLEIDAPSNMKSDVEEVMADLSQLMSLAPATLDCSERTDSIFEKLLRLAQVSPSHTQDLLIIVLGQYHDYLVKHERHEDAKRIQHRLQPIREEWMLHDVR